MSGRHVALIVEDDPLILEILVELVKSMGHDCRTATTLVEATREIAHGGFCYVLLDMQFPADGSPQSRANVACGDTALALIRKKDFRTTARGKHRLPVIIVTSYSQKPEFVSRMLVQREADDFIAKPFEDRLELVLDQIRGVLERAERAEHEACEADQAMSGSSPLGAPSPHPSSPAPAPAPAAATPPAVILAIDGSRGTRKSNVTVSGEPRALQDALFASLVPLMGVHRSTPGAWAPAARVGLARKPHLPHRIRKALEDVLPEGFELIQANKAGEYRLNERVVIGDVAWEALLDHPEVEVQKAAKEQVARRR